MRIAVVRGANLNPWELANFELPAHDVVAIGSQRGTFDAHALEFQSLALRSPAEVVARLPGRLKAAAVHFGGDPGYLFGLQEALKGFDIAHTAELSSPYSLQALKARERGHVARVVATVWENIESPPLANPLVARRARRVALGADRFLAISSRARRHLEHAGVPAERIDVIPMGVDIARFAPAPRSSDQRGDLRILSVSRLVPEKGVEDLVAALGLLHASGVAASVTFAGAGPSLERLRRMAGELGVSDRVRFAGVLPYEQLAALHRDHDVFVLASAPRPTWEEQFGFAVVEAMASGLPVLAGDSGSLPEVVGDPRQLVAPHQPQRLADALAALAADPARRAELGAANRRVAQERYDRTLVAQRILAFYERALEASPASTSSSRPPMALQS